MKDKLSKTELEGIAGREIRNCVGFLSSQIVGEREEALKRYNGEPYDDEQAGRSKVVSRDTMEAVEWALPSLLRIFTAGDDVVSYEPEGPEDEEFAKQATDYANYIFNTENNGFLVLHDMFKDALLQKVGVVKHWWEDVDREKVESYEALTDEEMISLLDDDGVEVEEHTEYGDEIEGQPIILHDLKVRRKYTDGKVCIEAIPPEEFLISSRARSIEAAGFVGHKTRKTRSELLEMGFDKKIVATLGDEGDSDYLTGEHETRMSDEEADANGSDAADDSMANVTFVEGYLKVDVNKDGIAELVKVSMAGSGTYQLLDYEEVGRRPFSAVCPIRTPHKFFGMSLADMVADIARIKTTLMRQMLDNLYLTNNPEREVDVTKVANMEDFLTSRPGGLKRVKQIGASREITVPYTAAASSTMLDYMDGVKETRTGVSPATSLDAEMLQNQTATAFNGAQAAAQQRIELIARIFAETGVRDLFKNILEIICTHQDREKVIRLRNKWVPMDPRNWNPEMDVRINVGLGHGNRDQQAAFLMQILALQEKAMANSQALGGLVTAENIYNTVEKLVNAVGFKNVDAFFNQPEPKQQQQQGQPENPEVAKAAMDAKVEEIKASQDFQIEQAKIQANMQLKREQMQAEMVLKREQMAIEAELKAQQGMMAGNVMSPVRMGGNVG